MKNAVLLVGLLALAAMGVGQNTKPKFKAIWEPVNYPQDSELRDAFFVSADEGWVAGLTRSDAGEGGILLHTKDGGEHWDVQVGDPHSATRGFETLFFLDRIHGWATQDGGGGLLKTTDGENWESVNSMNALKIYKFNTPNVGFILDGDKLYRSEDAGHSSKEITQCRAKVEVEGLIREVQCEFRSIDFATPNFGYIATSGIPGHGSAIFTTEDGGLTWNLSHFAPDVGAEERGLLFTNEKTGFMRASGGKVLATLDGGATWRGVATTYQHQIRFAGDRQVGWIAGDRSLVYFRRRQTLDRGRSALACGRECFKPADT